jgi:microcystin-dependent protein
VFPANVPSKNPPPPPPPSAPPPPPPITKYSIDDDINTGGENVDTYAAVDNGGYNVGSDNTSTKTTNASGTHTHTFTTNNTGGSQPHNNMSPILFGSTVLIFAKPIYPPVY